MKIAIIGLTDFPLGKKNLVDQRVTALEDIIKPSKATFITIEFLDSTGLKDADGIICEKESRLELVINDLESVENRLMRVKDEGEIKLLSRAKEVLEKNICLCEENFNPEEKKILVNSNFASIKPTYFVDKNENREAQSIIFDSYYALGMICFITGTKDKELRAWSIKKGATVFDAAGTIHSDIQRRFVKAEVIAYGDLLKAGGMNQAKQFMHLENKDYVMQDADVLNILTSNK